MGLRMRWPASRRGVPREHRWRWSSPTSCCRRRRGRGAAGGAADRADVETGAVARMGAAPRADGGGGTGRLPGPHRHRAGQADGATGRGLPRCDHRGAGRLGVDHGARRSRSRWSDRRPRPEWQDDRRRAGATGRPGGGARPDSTAGREIVAGRRLSAFPVVEVMGAESCSSIRRTGSSPRRSAPSSTWRPPSSTWRSSAPDRRARGAAVNGASEGLSTVVSKARHSGARPGRAR